MINNLGITAKKYVFSLLEERYMQNDPILSRISHYLATEDDVKAFCQLIADCYAKGYGKASADYQNKIREVFGPK